MCITNVPSSAAYVCIAIEKLAKGMAICPAPSAIEFSVSEHFS